MRRLLPLIFFVLFLLTQASSQTVQPDTTLSLDEQASRFLAQATFGPSPAAITELRNLGYDYNAWIDLEVAKAPTLAAPLAVAAFANDEFVEINNFQNRRYRNWVMLSGSDQLRQRVAYALTQIFVISDNTASGAGAGEGSSSYYDMLLENCSGNFHQ